MLVRCIATALDELLISDQHREYLATWFGSGNTKREWDNVTVGQVGTVYAIYVYNGFPFYFVQTKWTRDWRFIPNACFETVDARVSKYWLFDIRPSKSQGWSVVTRLAPIEFHEPTFLERLVDNGPGEVALMTEITKRMDAEFA